MSDKEIKKITEPFREKGVVHLFLARTAQGISLSSIADGDDIYDFLQVMIDQSPVVLDIMRAVIERRENAQHQKSEMVN